MSTLYKKVKNVSSGCNDTAKYAIHKENEMTAVIYGSSTGNTEKVAREICKLLGDDKSVLIEISTLQISELKKYSNLLLGASTWGYGDLQDDWETSLEFFKGTDLSGKMIGFFGCGDQESFSDTFVDSLGIIHETIKNSGAEFFGSWPKEGYSFTGSKALINGSFIGLAIDEDCQPSLSSERIRQWVDSLGI